MVQFSYLSRLIITFELYCWESELTLLHIVVDLLIEIVAHICLEDDREMISEPYSVAARV